jgi:4-phytase/acid phosphatase
MSMSMTFRTVGMLLALGMLSPGDALADEGGQATVVQRIILMRHGIRSPTKAPADLARYASEPWPAWPVAPGLLTPHGIDTLRSLGKRMRRDLADAGLPTNACKREVRVIADSTPRNQASAKALLEGLSPACAPAWQAFPVGQDDPLFRGTSGGDDDDKAGIDAAAIDGTTRATMAELQQVLLGCHDDACLAKAKSDGKQVLLGGDAAKALKTAGSLSENIMLAYVQGMPAAQFGWGRLDAEGVARVIGLHNTSFKLAHATPEASRGRGGNMLAHISATLAEAAGMPATVKALAPAGTRVIVLIGHDTDLAAQAGLLGLDWHTATRGDDFPPGGALVYDLVKVPGGYAVRLSVAMPTLAALRAGDVIPANAIVLKSLPQPDCGAIALCPISSFAAASGRAVGDAVLVSAANEPMTSAVGGP